MESDRRFLERLYPSLPQIIASIENSFDAISIIVHGSRAVGAADEWSDIDILLVLHETSSAPLYEEIDGFPIDLTVGTLRSLRARMRRDSKRNANFILNALCAGKVWSDSEGHGAQLIKEAWQLRMSGPACPTEAELSDRLSYLQKLSTSVRRLSARAESRPDGPLLALMRCDTLMVESMYTYHRVHRLWASGLAPMVKRARLEAPRLYELWNLYALAPSLSEKLSHAEAMTNLAFERPGDNFRDERFGDE